MIYLRLLGTASVEVAGAPVKGSVAQRRRVAILALLAAARGLRLGRDRIIGYLWPEMPQTRARHLLSESLYVVRKALGETVITAEGDYLQLSRAGLGSDLWDYEEALTAGDLERAVSTYGGQLLEGLYLDEAPEFERWLEEERWRLERSFRGAMEALAELVAGAGEEQRAVELLRRLAAADPQSSRVALKLMRLLERTGDRAGAIQHARVHALAMREDLGAEPDPEIAAYAERLRAEPRPPEPGIAAKSTPPRAAAPAPWPDSPLVAPAPPRHPPAGEPPGLASPGHVVAQGPRSGSRRLRPLLAAASVLLLLITVALAWQRGVSRGEEALPEERSIAVLPFAAGLGEHPPEEHVRDGITEELIHALSEIRGLRVTSSTSSFRFRSRGEQGIGEIGERLGVDVIVEGSMGRRGEDVIIRVQLVDVRSGFNVWSREFDRNLEEVSTFPREIARTIAATLRVTLAPEEQVAPLNRWTADPRARELYWVGRSQWNRRSAEGFRAAVAAYESAIARDPSFPLPYAGLADVSAQVLWSGEDPSKGYGAARAFAERALQLEPRLAEARATLGVVKLYYDRDWVGAEREFRRAVQLNPSYATGYQWYGSLLSLNGHFSEALQMLRRAEELDPISAPIRTSTATVLYQAGRFEEAVEHFRRALEIDNTFWPALAQRSAANSLIGRHTEALSDARRAAALGDGHPLALAVLAIAYAKVGRDAEARQTEREMREAEAAGQHVSPTLRAGVLVALGEEEAALELLERAVAERDELVVLLGVEPLFEPLRRQPRFHGIVERTRRPLTAPSD